MTCEGKAAMGFGEMFPQDEKKHREEMAPFLPLDMDVSTWKAWNCSSQPVMIRAVSPTQSRINGESIIFESLN